MTAVNDAPSFTDGRESDRRSKTPARRPSPAGRRRSAPGPPNEAARLVDLHRHQQQQPGAVQRRSRRSSPTGTLTYTPAANANGTRHGHGHALRQRRHRQRRRRHVRAADLHDHRHAVNDAPELHQGRESDRASRTPARRPSPAGRRRSARVRPNEAGQTLTFNVTGNTNNALFSAQPAVVIDRHADLHAGAERQRHRHGHADAHATTAAPPTAASTPRAAADLHDHRHRASTTRRASPRAPIRPCSKTPARRPSPAGRRPSIRAGPDEAGQTLALQRHQQHQPGAVQRAARGLADRHADLHAGGQRRSARATITVTLADNGGTANGGVDTSAPQTFTITVTAVNDAPSFTPGANPDGRRGRRAADGQSVGHGHQRRPG